MDQQKTNPDKRKKGAATHAKGTKSKAAKAVVKTIVVGCGKSAHKRADGAWRP